MKVKIPYELLDTINKKDLCPMSKIGYFLKAVFEIDGQIDVSKIWINQFTEDKLKSYFLKYLEKYHSKAQAKAQLGWYILQIGPAVDIKDEKSLENDYIYYLN